MLWTLLYYITIVNIKKLKFFDVIYIVLYLMCICIWNLNLSMKHLIKIYIFNSVSNNFLYVIQELSKKNNVKCSSKSFHINYYRLCLKNLGSICQISYTEEPRLSRLIGEEGQIRVIEKNHNWQEKTSTQFEYFL